MLQGLVMIRRLKADVVKHFPAKHREVSMFNLIGGTSVLSGPAEGEAARAPAAGEVHSCDPDNGQVLLRLKSEQTQNLNQQVSNCQIL